MIDKPHESEPHVIGTEGPTPENDPTGRFRVGPAKRWRRHYAHGKCQDCGRTRRVTVVRFWVNYMRYVVCSDCIRAYRPVLLTNTPREEP